MCAYLNGMTDGLPTPARTIKARATDWSIREFDSPRTPGAKAQVSLICESNSAVRRLWNFPANWRTMSELELLELFDLA